MSDRVTGAEALVLSSARAGVDVCFANPGTTEMPLVAALDRVPGVRAVLGLQENVCTGAADGYARVAGRPAMTLLHLGPGLANGWANLHNARRAHTPILNVVGDHTSWHLPYDAPLTSDITALAEAVGTCHAVSNSADIAASTTAAVDEANRRRGVVTLVVPADHQQAMVGSPVLAAKEPADASAHGNVSAARVDEIAQVLRRTSSGVILLGGNALRVEGQLAANRVARRLGFAIYAETFPARAERGAGLPAIDRLPYFPEQAVAALQGAAVVLVAGAEVPVAYFGYPGTPSELAPAGTVVVLAGPIEDAEQALIELAAALDVAEGPVLGRAERGDFVPDGTPLSGAVVGAVVADELPDGAIVSVEGGTCGYPFYSESARSAAHTVLTNTGGAIGQGLPTALGAAIAAPDRPVIALQSDGSGLYTVQALWTMAREACDVTVLIAANDTYGVLRTELARHGVDRGGSQAERLTSLAEPCIDWQALATSLGVPARRVTTAGELRGATRSALATAGPHVIAMAL